MADNILFRRMLILVHNGDKFHLNIQIVIKLLRVLISLDMGVTKIGLLLLKMLLNVLVLEKRVYCKQCWIWLMWKIYSIFVNLWNFNNNNLLLITNKYNIFHQAKAITNLERHLLQSSLLMLNLITSIQMVVGKILDYKRISHLLHFIMWVIYQIYQKVESWFHKWMVDYMHRLSSIVIREFKSWNLKSCLMVKLLNTNKNFKDRKTLLKKCVKNYES